MKNRYCLSVFEVDRDFKETALKFYSNNWIIYFDIKTPFVGRWRR